MNVSILGGGNEVGASCLHIEIGDTALLIDAGMRMHGDDALPALGMLESLKAPDAILITHAHADHIGALPIVHSLYPSVPLFATPPTVELMKVMMKDSYKILAQRSQQTHTLLPYTEEQVQALLMDLRYLPGNGILHIGSLKITSFQAGHILGAVMFLIEGEGETLLVTGDLSFKAGRTIPGAKVPQQLSPDVVIMESTYGNRAHTDRHTEEKRLAEHVAEVISSGGFALIPAFALGRAQEVLLVLQDYMDKGLIPEFPIYVDGLVTPISRIYKSYPQFLKGNLAYQIQNHGDVFLREGRCTAVQPKEREQILQGKPGCIVASSGMLTGGASSWYAEKLVSDPKNAIFITGYQDEESPGKKLLNLADGTDNHLELNGRSYPVQCRVGKYGLSAHADANEMDRFIQGLKPTHTLLVHGDDEARAHLADKLDDLFHPLLVENGETYHFERRKSGKGVVGKRYQSHSNQQLSEMVGNILLYASNESLKLAICTGVHHKSAILFGHTLKGKPIKLTLEQVVETFGSWNRSIEELREQTDEVLAFSKPYLDKLNWRQLPLESMNLLQIFQHLEIDSLSEKLAVALAVQALPELNKSKAPYIIYKLDQKALQALEELTLPIQGLKVNPAQALDEVRRYLFDHPRFIRCGVEGIGGSQEQIMIYFDFPNAVTHEEKQQIASAIKGKTGWNMNVSGSVRQDLLQTVLAKLTNHTAESVSIHLQERRVVASFESPESLEVQKQYKQITGFDLQVKNEKNSKLLQAVNSHIFHVQDTGGRMENNQAIEEAKDWAKRRNLTIYKTGIKQQGSTAIMEVHFISPQMALRHTADLKELSYRIGMPVTFAKQPKQNEIIQQTLSLLPESWELKKNPSIHLDRGTVGLKLLSLPKKEEIQYFEEKIEELTGYTVEVLI